MEQQPTEQHEISEFTADYWINNQKYKIAPQRKAKTFWPPSSPETSPERPTEPSASTSRAVPRPESDQETTSEQDKTLEYETKDSNNNNNKMTSSPKEIQLNNPKPFNGNRNDLNKFIWACSAYLDLNTEIFNSDKKKILFVLSYMTEGTPEAWEEV